MDGIVTGEVTWRVADTTARNAIVVSPLEVGKVCQVLASSGTLYQAIKAGTGSDCWGLIGDGVVTSDEVSNESSALGATVTAALDFLVTGANTIDGKGLKKASKTVGFAQLTDADGAQTFAFAAALPASAVVVGASINVTQAFTDGATGVFTADVGINGGDQDALVDGAAIGAIARVGSPFGVGPCGFYGAITPAITILATVNLNTRTAGSLVCEVYYFEAANL